MEHATKYDRAGLSHLLKDTCGFGGHPLGQVLHDLLRAARMYLGMEIAFISEFTEDRRVFRYVDHAGGEALIRVGASNPLEEGYCKKVVEGRLPQLIQDAQELAEARAIAATQELGIGAHMSVPIRLRDGSVYGTFCTFSFWADHTLNERDLALMSVFADIAGGLIQNDIDRTRTEQARRLLIEQLFEDAAFHTVWQPIFDVASGRMVGAESLSRFPAEPARTPPQWFDEATQVGLGEALERRAIEKGLAALPQLPDGMYIACNASARAFLEGQIATTLLETTPLDRVILEMTEHELIEDYAALAVTLDPLRARGLRLAVDDAGAGYASFRHVLRLRPDVIKLDMSLIRGIDSDISQRCLAESFVRLAENIGAMVVAEGVETRAELDALVGCGIHKAQGFFLSRPLELEAFVEAAHAAGSVPGSNRVFRGE